MRIKSIGAKMLALVTLDWHGVLIYYVQLFTDVFFPNDEVFRNVRAVLLRAAGLRIAWDARIGRRSVIVFRRGLSIGRRTTVNHECYFDCTRPVTIGDCCNIGFRVAFVTAGHRLKSDYAGVRPHDEARTQPITLEDFVWIGSNVTILPGVTIGRGAVVAAGAVVAENVAPDTVVAGVPARKIKDLK